MYRDIELGYQTDIEWKVRAVERKLGHYTPPTTWHTAADPADVQADLNVIFTELNMPIYGVRVGIAYAKYEIAKKLWIHRPAVMRGLLMVYMLVMLTAMSYAAVILQTMTSDIMLQLLIYAIYTLDAANRVLAICCAAYSIGCLFLTAAVAGCILGMNGDPIGWAIYCLAFVQILALAIREIYLCALVALFE
jgi:hypothetical protein